MPGLASIVTGPATRAIETASEFLRRQWVGLEGNRMPLKLHARRAVVAIRFALANQHHRPAKVLALVLLPIRRPFLFLANVCAELGVLFLKAEGYLLKLEKARLEIIGKR